MAKTVRGNIDAQQLKAASRRGEGPSVQMADQTAGFVAGDVPIFDATGNLVDGGAPPVTTGVTLTADQPVFGAGGSAIKVGTKSGNTDEVASVSGALTSGNVLKADASGNVADGGVAVSALVTSGVTLTADQPVFGAGTETVKVGTKSGNTDEVATVSGSLTSGNALKSDASGNLVDGGGPLATTAAAVAHEFLTSYTAATGAFTLAALAAADMPASVQAGGFGITIDGGGSAPATGSKGYLQVTYSGTITGWTLLADVSGSAQITVKKSTYAGFPTTSSIVASAPPALTSAQGATSTTLTGWTTTVTANDILEFNLDSVTTCTRLFLLVKVTRS